MHNNKKVDASGKSATLFDIQRFSLHDGPGIRTTLFFKGCPLSCIWCQNPESHKSAVQIAYYAESCVGCLACAAVCPSGAILSEQSRRVDFSRCTTCGKCVEACSNNALRLIGNVWDAAGLVMEVSRDADFFAQSGGGITLSGGEPTIWHGFLLHFLPMIKQQGIHVNLETSGLFSPLILGSVFPFIDEVYFDLKCMDSRMHKRLCGIGNQAIQKNFSALAKQIPSLTARMPVVPGINDSKENFAQTASFLIGNGHNTLHLLKYHRMWEAKLIRFKTGQRVLDIPSADNDSLMRAKDILQSCGIRAVIYD